MAKGNIKLIDLNVIKDFAGLTTIRYVSEVKAIADLLCPLGIDYFSYVENTSDGTVIALLNKEEFAQAYLANQWYSLDFINTNFNFCMQGMYLWDAINQSEFKKLRALVERVFKIYHGCSITKVNKGIKKTYNFATSSKHNVEIQNFYINNSSLLQAYIRYFEDKASHLINTSDQIIIPEHLSSRSSTNLSHITEQDEQKFLQGLALKYNLGLSPREVECLRLIATTGNSTKQIADFLGLSCKTVESYIRNSKVKLRCHTKAELIIEAYANDIVKR